MKAIAAFLVLTAMPALAQPPSVEQELRSEVARLKESLARAEALLDRVEKERAATKAPAPGAEGKVAQSVPAPSVAPIAKPPGMNTPPKLPASDPENYKKAPPRLDVLMQVRYDGFSDLTRNSTFFLRKAEVGLKGNISKYFDFSIEVDLGRTTVNDPYRRTYIRYSRFKHFFLKAGMEKAPLGLEELSSSGQLPFVDRSEVSDRFSAAEELGVFSESSWDRFMVQTSLTNGGRRLYRDDNRRKTFTARAVWAATPMLSLGAATMQGDTGATVLERTRYNLEAKYGKNNIQGAQAEFYSSRDGTVHSSAFYAQTYWAKPVKASWLTHVMPVARYEHIDRDDGNRAQELRLMTLGLGLLFNENKSKFQFNWLHDLRSNSPRKNELRGQFTVEY